MTSPNDIYTTVTQKIISDLEKGDLTWRKPWNSKNLGGNVMRPLRHNDIAYTGINTILLWSVAVDRGFTSPYWMTFKQASDMKAHVRKGERGSPVVFASKYEKEEAAADGESTIKEVPFLKQYTVFNANQIEGLSEAFNRVAQNDAVKKEKRVDLLEQFFSATQAKVFTGTKAAYFIGPDKIEMPPFEAFDDAVSYYGTLAHETTHWTRHPSRLNRDFNRKKWGDEGYAKEELVAELAACFLGADLGYEPVTREEHAAYIQSWLSELQNDKRFIFQAASYAQKAVEYLHSLQPVKAKLTPAPV